MDDLVKRLREHINLIPVRNIQGRTFHDWEPETLIEQAADRIEALEQAIKDWAGAIIDWEGIDFVERIENETSRALIEAALAGEKKE